MKRYQGEAVSVQDQREWMAEHRSKLRKREFMSEALITLAGGEAVRCTVRDVSTEGARMEVERTSATPKLSATDIADRFEAFFPREGTEVTCQVAWRDGRHFGVSFAGEPRRLRRPA